MQQHLLLLVNPFSGNKKGLLKAIYIKENLEANNVVCELFSSVSSESFTTYIQEHDLLRYTAIGIVGGDGTFHDGINAILNKYTSFELPIALFPAGTGNSFNLDIGCTTIQETLNCVLKNTSHFIDVAEVNYSDKQRWAFNILGCGLVADINRLAEKLRFLGGMRYNVASVIKLLQNRTTAFKIQTDEGTQEGEFSFVLACNTRYTGKGMMMAPLATLEDGKFDVLLVKACSRFTLLKLFPKIFKGQHMGAQILQYIQTSHLKVESKATSEDTNIDGEMNGQTPFTLRVHPKKIKVFVKEN